HAGRPLETVGGADARVGRCAALDDRTAHGIARQAANLDTPHEVPLSRDAVRAQQADAGEEQAAVVDAVKGLHRLRARPRRLDEDAGLGAAFAVHAERRAQVELRAAVALQVAADAQQAVDRRGPELEIG